MRDYRKITQVDELHRIQLPADFCNALGIEIDDQVSLELKDNAIAIKKFSSASLAAKMQALAVDIKNSHSELYGKDRKILDDLAEKTREAAEQLSKIETRTSK